MANTFNRLLCLFYSSSSSQTDIINSSKALLWLISMYSLGMSFVSSMPVLAAFNNANFSSLVKSNFIAIHFYLSVILTNVLQSFL